MPTIDHSSDLFRTQRHYPEDSVERCFQYGVSALHNCRAIFHISRALAGLHRYEQAEGRHASKVRIVTKYETKVKEVYPDAKIDDSNKIFSEARANTFLRKVNGGYRHNVSSELSIGCVTPEFAWYKAWKTVNQDMIVKLES